MTLREIAALVGGELHGPADLQIKGPGSIDSDEADRILFAVSEHHLAKIEDSRAAAILVPRNLTAPTKPYIQVDNPKVAFARLLQDEVKPLPLAPGTHSTAIIDPSATVSSHAQVGAYAVIERGAKIGPGSRIYPFAYIGEDCIVGENCTIYPHAVLYQKVALGDSTTVHAGAVLGADGFGFVWHDKRQVKMPHTGSVRIGNDCEIGALSAIDRAMIGQTTIDDDTKIDNLVQIGHNATVGQHTVIASQAGISGSAHVGDRVMIAGQVGVGDHVTITSDVVLAARTAALQDIDQPGAYIGTPAQPMAIGKRVIVLLGKLPELFERVRKLEKRDGE